MEYSLFSKPSTMLNQNIIMPFNSDYVTKKCQLKYIFPINDIIFQMEYTLILSKPLNVQSENIIILL